MSQEKDLEALRGVYEAWGRGEFWDPSIYDPEIVFVLGAGFPDPGAYEGIEGMGRGFRGWLESWRDLRFELEEMFSAGERIVAVYHLTGIGRASGIATALHGGHIWTMRDGRAVRLEVYSNRDEALEAAGLSE